MNKELLNILSDSYKDIDNQKLMDYLSNKLSAEEKHDMEMQIADAGLLADAVEGLEGFENKKDLLVLAEQLNADLHKQLNKKKVRKEKRKLKDQPWLYLAIIIILLITLLCFVLVKRHLDSEKEIQKKIPSATEQKISR